MATHNLGDNVRLEETSDGKLRIVDQDTGDPIPIEAIIADLLEIDGSRLYIQDTEPADAGEDDVWINTS